jgi:hypothetical protein
MEIRLPAIYNFMSGWGYNTKEPSGFSSVLEDLQLPTMSGKPVEQLKIQRRTIISIPLIYDTKI